MRTITLGSLFDGSGGFPLAGFLCGIKPVWASEIEPYPLKVTEKRFPCMTQLGDVTKINGAEIEPVDIITFGSPCQDLSVAGKQEGIHSGKRSRLFFEAIRIIKEMRENEKQAGRTGVDVRPRFAVWENVPGAFSSNNGHDFHAVLQAIAEVGRPDVHVSGCEGGGRTPDVSWQTAVLSRGGCLTLNTGASPNVAKESTLSQILQENVPQKFYLSAKACAGILRRAEKRGKELPKMLKEALEEVIALDSISNKTQSAEA